MRVARYGPVSAKAITSCLYTAGYTVHTHTRVPAAPAGVSRGVPCAATRNTRRRTCDTVHVPTGEASIFLCLHAE